MSNSGKGGDSRGNRRRSSKHKEREKAPASGRDSSRGGGGGGKKAIAASLFGEGRSDKKRADSPDRLRWAPPKPPAEPLPTGNCAWCGKPIKDMTSAISDGKSGQPIHFDCVIARIGASERLGPGDAVSYIGGGRFGVVHFNNFPDTRNFKIKKILEWENKDNRTEWRHNISAHFSVT